MDRFMLTITVATAALFGAYNASAETLLYTSPGATSEVAQPLGAFMASRLTDKNTTEFRDWLAQQSINGNIDLAKGYTLFAVVDSDFDPSNPEHPAEHYIVNGRAPIVTMHGDSDEVTALNGDSLTVGRTGNSYNVEGKRVNSIIKNPEGTIYTIGGPVSAFSL